MSSLSQEIATRARKLVKLHGAVISSSVTGANTGRHLRIGDYYMRVRIDGDLYINDIAHRTGWTVYIQDRACFEGKCLTQADGRRLRTTLRLHMVLQDLADV